MTDKEKSDPDGVALKKVIDDAEKAKKSKEAEIAKFKLDSEELEKAKVAEEKDNADADYLEKADAMNELDKKLKKAGRDVDNYSELYEEDKIKLQQANTDLKNAKDDKEYWEIADKIAKLERSMSENKFEMKQAELDKTRFQAEYDTAKKDVETAEGEKKAKWTAAGFDPNDKSFNVPPPGKGGSATDGKGGSHDHGKDGSATGQGGKGDDGNQGDGDKK